MATTPMVISAGQDSPDSVPSHLQWLNTKDQRTLARSKCQDAAREESRLLREMQATISGYESAIEHCRAANENDPEWFTLDVQDSHARRITILRDALSVLVNDPIPLPEGIDPIDGLKGKIFSGYAKTAEVTSRLTSSFHADPGVQQIAERSQAAFAGARASFSAFTGRLRSSFSQKSSPTASTSVEPSFTGPGSSGDATRGVPL
eukprot:CAMPEP_0169120336 /NCGR_PEP_ID=MMETSP1015-20121227/32045_1 /TAXON_ID=342587 /ORGANISM="Karlodinium micrum, Strain CCMP2283" /LENGTH=204 /DNA_ID=CAMNT_0009183295 /DNA_START=67 /DNA_END=681 /DNA_ORIENTATION=-